MYWCKQIRKKIMGVYNMLKIKLTCIKRNRIKKNIMVYNKTDKNFISILCSYRYMYCTM